MKIRHIVICLLPLFSPLSPAQEAPAPPSAQTELQEHPFFRTELYPAWSKMTPQQALTDVRAAIAQAQEFGHSVRREVGYLTIHSMLHLRGYDHLDEGEQKRQMRGREETIAAHIPGMNID